MKYDHLCINCMNEKPQNDRYCPICGFDERKYTYPERSLPPYTILNGRYIIGRMLGSGGFGITYIALDTTLDKVVAIKEFFITQSMYRNSTQSLCTTVPDTTESEKRIYDVNRRKFEEEAKILAKLDPIPGIVRVYHLFEENNTLYFVMDYLSGMTLKEYCLQYGRMSFPEILGLVSPIMDALSSLHSIGIYHRDISPDNIMVSEKKTLTLFDFGGAKIQTGNGQSSMILAKAGFTPVEQLQYEGQVGPWTDVYALSATIYYCLTGLTPPPASMRVGNEKILVSPREAGAGISPEQEKALLKGMALSFRDRYQSMSELKNALSLSNQVSGHIFRTGLIVSVILAGVGILSIALIFGNRLARGKKEASLPAVTEESVTLEPSITGTAEMPAPEMAETPVIEMTETPVPKLTETAEVPAPRVTETSAPETAETTTPEATVTQLPDATEMQIPETAEMAPEGLADTSVSKPAEASSKPLLLVPAAEYDSSDELLYIVKDTTGIPISWIDSYSLQYVYAPQKKRGIGITGYTRTEILSACRYDFDGDGQDELLAVVFEGAGTRQEDNNLVLFMLEQYGAGKWDKSGNLMLEFPVVENEGEQNIYIGSSEDGETVLLVQNKADGEIFIEEYIYENREFRRCDEPEVIASAKSARLDLSNAVVSCRLDSEKGIVYQNSANAVKEWETLDYLNVNWADAGGSDVRRLKQGNQIKYLQTNGKPELKASEDLKNIAKEVIGVSSSETNAYSLQYVYAPHKSRGVGITGYTKTELLSACQYDFDGDGQEEILTVLFEGAGTRQEDNNLVLLMMEPNSAGGWDVGQKLLLEFPIAKTSGEQDIYIGSLTGGGAVVLIWNEIDQNSSLSGYVYDNSEFKPWKGLNYDASTEKILAESAKPIVGCSLYPANGSVYGENLAGLQEWDTLDDLEVIWVDYLG